MNGEYPAGAAVEAWWPLDERSTEWVIAADFSTDTYINDADVTLAAGNPALIDRAPIRSSYELFEELQRRVREQLTALSRLDAELR